MSKPILRLILLILFCFTFPVAKSDGKHIIIAYDISKSMYHLKNPPSDLKRVNDYLTEMLFSEIPKHPKQTSDDIIKLYYGEPFYKVGDLISYFQFATDIEYKLQKLQGVTSPYFETLLPDPVDHRISFYGKDTFLGKAKVDIYTKLYQKGEETYWILVSDEDEDRSIALQKDPTVQKTLAKIDEDYDEPRVFEILVNKHVTIRVHKIIPHDKEDITIYVALADIPNKPVERIRFSKDKGGQRYVSPQLIVNSESPDKSDFILESLGVRVLSKNGAEVYTAQIPLDSKEIGDKFTIELPSNVDGLKRRGNQMELTLQCQHNGVRKDLQVAMTNYLLREGVPTWPFWLILFIALGISCYFGGRWVYAQFIRGGSGTTIDIVLSKASSSGAVRGDSKGFSLQEGDVIYFDRTEGGGNVFDVGCPGYFLDYMDKDILLHEDAFDETGRALNDGDTFALTHPDGNTIHVKLEFSAGFEEYDEFVDDEEFVSNIEEGDGVSSKRRRIIGR